MGYSEFVDRDYAPAESPERPSKGIDRVLDEQESQIGGFSSIMRRIDELADRVCGVIPTAGEAKSSDIGPDFGQGIVAAFRRINADRENTIARINASLDRIEKIL